MLRFKFFYLIKSCLLISFFEGVAQAIEPIHKRIEVRVEGFEMNPTGNSVLRKLPFYRQWRIDENPSDGFWTPEITPPYSFLIQYHMLLQPDGLIRISIEQYEKIEKPVFKNNVMVKGKLIQRKEFLLSDFSSAQFVAEGQHKERFVLRFTPQVLDDETPQDLTSWPISGKNIMVYDSKGQIWNERWGVSGKYVSLQIWQRGAIFMSFSPFQGAQPLGSAIGKKIELKIRDRLTLKFVNDEAFVPEGVHATVYGVFKEAQESTGYTSPMVNATESETIFLKSLQRFK